MSVLSGPPRWFELELVPYCDYRCLHCPVWEGGASPRALSFERWLGLVDEIAGWSPGAALSVTTGEPFLHPRVLELVSAAAGRGLDVFLNTHAGRIDEELARRIAASGLGMLWVSLDGSRPATHDHGRGVPGAHAAAVGALELLRRAGHARCGLVSIVMAHNLAELGPLAAWAGEQGLASIEFQPLRPQGRGWEPLWPGDASALRRAFAEVEKARRAGAPVHNPPEQLEAMLRYYASPQVAHERFDCRSAATLVIENDGLARSCRFMEPIGRVGGDTPLRELWESAEGRRRRAAAAACHESCVLLGCHFPFPEAD